MVAVAATPQPTCRRSLVTTLLPLEFVRHSSITFTIMIIDRRNPESVPQDVDLLGVFTWQAQANRHSHRSLRRGKLLEFQPVARFDVNVQYGTVNQHI